MKLPLQRRSDFGRGKHWKSCAVLKSLPYIVCRNGITVHRVRSGTVHASRGGYVCYDFQCGGATLTDQRYGGKLVDSPNHGNKPLCQKCEAMAVKRGLPSSEFISGGVVWYHVPRHKRGRS